MYLSIGKKKESGDLVDALVECHDRIRSFTAVAQKLATSREAAPAEVREAAARVRRYFEEALPRHVADEEESILPRLSGRDPALDATLARMHAEHAEHERPLAAMLGLLRVLEQAPERLDELRAELLELSTELGSAFAEHLSREETLIFPQIRGRLSPHDQAAIAAELRARRS